MDSVLPDSVFVWNKRSMPSFSVAARAMARLVSWPLAATRVTNMPNLQDFIKVVNSVSFADVEGGEAFALAV